MNAKWAKVVYYLLRALLLSSCIINLKKLPPIPITHFSFDRNEKPQFYFEKNCAFSEI